MFSLPRPIGTAIPHPPIYALANFDPADITGSIGSQPLGDGSTPLQFPTVNRKAKGNSLIARPREPLPPLPPLPADRAGAAGRDRRRAQDRSRASILMPSMNSAPPTSRARPTSRCRIATCRPRALPRWRRPMRPRIPRASFSATLRSPRRKRASTPWAPGEAPVVTARLAMQALATPISNNRRSRPARRRWNRRIDRRQRRGHRRGRAAAFAGRAARPRRHRARQGREVPRQCRLFRSARRTGARADRGGASGDEPRVLAVLSQRRLRRRLPERRPPQCLPVHLRLRRHSRRRHRAGRLGARQAHRPRHARRQVVDAGGGEVDPLSRLLGASGLGRRDEEGLQARRAYLLSPARMGRRLRRADLGQRQDRRATEKEAAREEEISPVSHSKEWLQSDGRVWARKTPANRVVPPAPAMRGGDGTDHEYSFG